MFRHAVIIQRPSLRRPVHSCPASLGRPTPLSAVSFRRSYAWNHDYRRLSQNLSAIIRELTYLDIHDDGKRVLMLDDSGFCQCNPSPLMWEPGFWNLTDREAESFRALLLKGGFAIFEDFDGASQWANSSADAPGAPEGGRASRQPHQLQRILPMKDIDAIVTRCRNPAQPTSDLRGHDPSRRLIVWPTMTTTCRILGMVGSETLSVRRVE